MKCFLLSYTYIEKISKMLNNWVGVVTGDVPVTPKPQEPPEPRSKKSRKMYESMGTLGDFLALKELFSQNPKTASNAASLARHHQKHSNLPQIIERGEEWLEKQRKKTQQRVEK